MDLFYVSDVPENVQVWNLLLRKLKGYNGLDGIDNEAWQIARASQKIPHMGNILMEVTAKRLGTAIIDRYPDADIEYYINGLDSSFWVNSIEILSIEDYQEAINSNI